MNSSFIKKKKGIRTYIPTGQKIKKEDWREMEMSIYESGGDETSFREVAEEKDISQEMAEAAFEEILHNKRQGESQYRIQLDRSLEACPSDALPFVFIPCKYQNMEDPRCCLNNTEQTSTFQVFAKPRCHRNLQDISMSPIGRSGSLPVDRPLFVRTSTPMRPTRSVTGSVDSLPSVLSPALAPGAPFMSPAMPMSTSVDARDSQASPSRAQPKICARTGASCVSKCGQGCSGSANQW
ncbi:hypothetical protein B9Z55_012883 [Caenorhabditis nigoni]|uniref:Uncharacterized protein n=1 Tax=Caenorhabditis nigoni TaxID=1611254 RepID=A0A2G5TZ72_9PELO|nr:hypothetical protein B9Z55_012883 [Caenorhabditis nigoni]